MKINGVEVSGPSEEVLVLPRPTGTDLTFIARAVLNFDEFEAACPMPKPKAMLKNGSWKEQFDDPSYKQAIAHRDTLRFSWTLLKSLEPSNIEWDTVEIDKPSTWANWEADLKKAGLSPIETTRIANCVLAANCLNEQKLEAARQSFLRGLAKASEQQSYQNSEPQTTPSGEGANE